MVLRQNDISIEIIGIQSYNRRTRDFSLLVLARYKLPASLGTTDPPKDDIVDNMQEVPKVPEEMVLRGCLRTEAEKTMGNSRVTRGGNPRRETTTSETRRDPCSAKRNGVIELDSDEEESPCTTENPVTPRCELGERTNGQMRLVEMGWLSKVGVCNLLSYVCFQHNGGVSI